MGVGKSLFFEALAQGWGGLRPIERFELGEFDVRWAGEVPYSNALIEDLAESYAASTIFSPWSAVDSLSQDPKVAFCLKAAEEALNDAGFTSLGPESLLHLGTSLETYRLGTAGVVNLSDKLNIEKLIAQASLRAPLDMAMKLIEERYGRAELALTNCSACAAALQALGQAYRAVRDGRFEMALAGAFDSMINPLGLGGFFLLGALAVGSPEPPWPLCQPFDLCRRGLVMGEGAALMVLEPYDKVKAQGRKAYAEIIGYGASLDAYGLSAPDPEGLGAYRAMRAALADASIKAEDVDHINAHATATRLNDPAEAKAIRALFPNWPRVPVTAIKSMIGHAIAAAGALEAASCLFTITEGLMPPNVGLERFDSDCELNHVMGKAQAFNGSIVLTNSFGFGGQNAAMIFKALQ
jgi:3-oxoacyl-[acyl-carrier-protein] synthase II